MSMEFEDRVSAYPNRYLMTDENGHASYVILEKADEPTKVGTPLNAETFNGMLAGLAPAIESADYPGCYYRTVGGVVEWLNPPMEVGVEYRTTERWLGKVVYTKLFYYGSLPTPEEGFKSVYFTDYTDSNREGIQVHNIEGRVGMNNADTGSTSLFHLRGIEYAYGAGNRVTIKTCENLNSTVPNTDMYAYVQVKYVKLNVEDL